MSLDRVKLFVSVAKTLNVSRAAREHRLSQPAVSRQLKILQSELGIRLVEKRGRGIILTSAGEAFLFEATTILARIDQFKKNHGGQFGDALTVAAGRGLSNYLLPALMVKFRHNFPQVILNLRTGSSSDIQSWLVKHQVDVAIMKNPATAPGIEKEPYTIEKRTAFVRPDHPLAHKNLETLAFDAQIDFVVRLQAAEQLMTALDLKNFQSHRVKYRIAVRCETPESVKELVRAGGGVGILFDAMVRPEIEAGNFAEVFIPGLDSVRRMYLVYHRHPASALVGDFLALIRAAVNPPRSERVKISRQRNRATGLARYLSCNEVCALRSYPVSRNVYRFILIQKNGAEAPQQARCMNIPIFP